VAGAAAGAAVLSDILADQPTDARTLAEIYDLEHDAIVEDLHFYAEMARREGPAILDLGCGSGRLFPAFLDGGATRIAGIDGSPALLERARARIERDPRLRAASEIGALELSLGDVRTARAHDRFDLVVLAGVLSHLDGPTDATRALANARSHLADGGAVVVDLVGPGGLPDRDLPASVDWTLAVNGARLVRTSGLAVSRTADGLRVDYATETERVEPGGTISRLPARFRLWYPSLSGLLSIVEEADLDVDVTFGSYELDALDEQSERCIMVLRRPTTTPRRG
jgi:SAM-dependent methyltransferase